MHFVSERLIVNFQSAVGTGKSVGSQGDITYEYEFTGFACMHCTKIGSSAFLSDDESSIHRVLEASCSPPLAH